MKSLEIINAKLNIAKQQKEDCVMEYKYFNDDNCDEIIELDRKITELLIIKQDLEVLKIMKRFLNECQPDIEYWNWRQSYALGICGEIDINEEEKVKLEKWLEE